MSELPDLATLLKSSGSDWSQYLFSEDLEQEHEGLEEAFQRLKQIQQKEEEREHKEEHGVEQGVEQGVEKEEQMKQQIGRFQVLSSPSPFPPGLCEQMREGVPYNGNLLVSIRPLFIKYDSDSIQRLTQLRRVK